MDALRAARLLEPLMPQEVSRWLRAREHGDGSLRELIDRRIIAQAHRVLGDYENKILLSLPPEKQIKGAFELGQVLYDKPRWPFGLRSSELLQNTLILGRSGAGKTNVAFLLLEQLTSRGIPFLFFDIKQTGRHLVPRLHRRVLVYTPGQSVSPLPFNPFLAPPDMEPQVYQSHVVDALAESFTLGDGARSVIQKALAGLESRDKPPTVQDVIAAVEGIPDKERVRGWKITALRALESLRLMSGVGTGAESQRTFARSLLRQNTIIELDGLGVGARRFLTSLLCLWVYHVRLGARDREKLRMVIVIEEAHYVLHRGTQRANETIMEMLLRQFRELGIGVIVIAQHPHLLSSAALGNCSTSTCMNLKDPADIARAAKLSLLQDDEARYLSMLPVGQGIVKLQGRWRHRPILVQFPEVAIDKGSVSSGDVAAWMAPEALKRPDPAGSGGSGPENGDPGRVRRRRLWDTPLNEGALRFIDDVFRHQDDGVKARYKRLRLSAHSGTRIQRALVSQGWLETAIVPQGNTRKRILRLSAAAKDAVRRDGVKPPIPGPRGGSGLVHDYWQRWWAQKLDKEGWDVQMEAPRRGGRVDILARQDGRTLAVEVETGVSDYAGNVQNCLRSGFDRVLVVATNEVALGKIEQWLAGRGLLIPRRLGVALRDRRPAPY